MRSDNIHFSQLIFFAKKQSLLFSKLILFFTTNFFYATALLIFFRDGPLFFGGGEMKNIEKNCLQGLERQNKLFANTICITKISQNFEKKMFAEVHKLKKKVCRGKFFIPPPPPL